MEVEVEDDNDVTTDAGLVGEINHGRRDEDGIEDDAVEDDDDACIKGIEDDAVNEDAKDEGAKDDAGNEDAKDEVGCIDGDDAGSDVEIEALRSRCCDCSPA